MYVRSILLFVRAVALIKLPWSILTLSNSDVLRQIVSSSNHAKRNIRLPWSIWRTKLVMTKFSLISWERDVPPSSTNTSCLWGCPDRSQVDFGICWVGLENIACWETSPHDCWTTFPSGCWSTVELNATSSLVQSWRNEIFGFCRGYMYDFSYKTFPVTTFGYNKLDVFLERWLHSIEFDWVTILVESQDQCQCNVPDPDVLPALCRYFVHDVIQWSQSLQDLEVFWL